MSDNFDTKTKDLYRGKEHGHHKPCCLIFH